VLLGRIKRTSDKGIIPSVKNSMCGSEQEEAGKVLKHKIDFSM